MYQVTLFDKDGAILHREEFQYQTDAIEWMVAGSTGSFTDDLGLQVKPTEWELTKIDMRMHRKLLNIVEHGAA